MKVASLTKWTIADLDRLPDDGNRYELMVHRFATGEPVRELAGSDILATPILPGFELPVEYIFR